MEIKTELEKSEKIFYRPTVYKNFVQQVGKDFVYSSLMGALNNVTDKLENKDLYLSEHNFPLGNPDRIDVNVENVTNLLKEKEFAIINTFTRGDYAVIFKTFLSE